ncbi:MAG TPA: peroxiredoxin-like family protein [Rhizomicrobium sp.]
MKKGSTLKEKLAARRVLDPVWKARYDGLVRRLVEAQIGQDALKAGDTCPDFMLPSAEGALINSADLLSKGPVVLSFYRGKWCPYCVTELEALKEATHDIDELGATLVAVTAEDCGGALAAKRDRALEFEILCDIENGLGLTFGLLFRVPPDFRDNYRGIGVDFPLIYGNDSWFLPVPATYVVGQDGVIRHAYVNPDFRERLDPQEILGVLKKLQK